MTLKFVSAPKRDWKHRYKFKRTNVAKCDGWYFKYPVVTEDGLLKDIKPKQGFIIEAIGDNYPDGGYFRERGYRGMCFVDQDILKSHVFNSEKEATQFMVDFNFEGSVKTFDYEVCQVA